MQLEFELELNLINEFNQAQASKLFDKLKLKHNL